MKAKKIFWGKKLILNSGREIDISSDQENDNQISILALFNHFDPIHEITKPISIRLEWNNKAANPNDPIISVECRGGSPREDRPISESELPIEGLNGFKDTLHLNELQDLLSKLVDIYKNIKQEAEKHSHENKTSPDKHLR